LDAKKVSIEKWNIYTAGSVTEKFMVFVGIFYLYNNVKAEEIWKTARHRTATSITITGKARQIYSLIRRWQYLRRRSASLLQEQQRHYSRKALAGRSFSSTSSPLVKKKESVYINHKSSAVTTRMIHQLDGNESGCAYAQAEGNKRDKAIIRREMIFEK